MSTFSTNDKRTSKEYELLATEKYKMSSIVLSKGKPNDYTKFDNV